MTTMPRFGLAHHQYISQIENLVEDELRRFPVQTIHVAAICV